MALASSAEVQDSLYPDFVAKGDELVLDYDEALNEYDIKLQLNEDQMVSLSNLEAYLEEHSGSEFEEMYCNSGSLYNDPRWEEIRVLAREFIESMGWQYQAPAKNDAVYVNTKNVVKNT